MKRAIIKVGLFSALSAFVLSFFFGLLAGSRFGWMVLRATLFAGLAAGVGIGCYLMYRRFLSPPPGWGEDDAEASPKTPGSSHRPLHSAGHGASHSKAAKASHQVNLVSPAEDETDFSMCMDKTGVDSELDQLQQSISNLETLGSVDMNDKSILEVPDQPPVPNPMGLETFSRQSDVPQSEEADASRETPHSFPSEVTLNDIGGPDAHMEDYAKAVRTMLKKNE